MKKDVFISYSSTDYEKVLNIKNILEMNEITCWMAPQSIPAGSSYANEIPNAINNCKVFLLMLTEKSQRSQWVPKELSIALSKRKCVIPFVIEDCSLTELFDFFLTDIQRYYEFEIQSDSLRELVIRIKTECGESDDLKKILGADKISEVETWIIHTDRNILNREMSKLLTLIKKKYKENPNAEFINSWFTCQKINKFGIRQILDSLGKCMIYLPAAAEIQIQIAVIFIHSGAKLYIKDARNRLNDAVKIYLNQGVYNENAFKRIIYARWLIAVTYKQERNFGQANELCENLIEYIKEDNKIFDIPYSESLLLPQREVAVINKEEIMSDYLTIHMDEIEMNPRELFYTQRRLLELHILNNEFEKARKLLPDLLLSFEKCKNHIDEIYHVGLYQNLFEYFSYIGDKETAEQYFKKALDSARKNYWKGKEKRLVNLKQIFE